jgi:hypothetical protein
MRLKGDHDRCRIKTDGPVSNPGNESLVPDVDAVKIADGDAGALDQIWGCAGPCDALHAFPPKNDWAWRLYQKNKGFNRRRRRQNVLAA